MTGRPSLPTEGGTQALRRSETMAVVVEGRDGFVCRPNLVGALVVKAAAHGNPSDPARRRHRQDFVVLAGLLTAEDFAAEKVSATDRRRLRAIVSSVMADQELLLEIPDAQIAINRLTTAAELDE